jgi:hypothetical protein
MTRLNVGNIRHPDGTDDNINLDSSGRVGIGTASPASKLHVYENSASPARIYLENTEGRYEIKADANLALHYSTQFVFNNAAGTQEYARIDSSSRLLVGTSSAVSADTNALIHIAGPTSGNIVLANKTTSLPGSASIGAIRFFSNAGSVYEEHGRIQCSNDGGSGSGDKPGRLVFSTTADGASSPTERLRIRANGNTEPGADNTYTIGTSDSRWGSVWAANGTIQTSDERTKTQIANAHLGFEFIKSLRPVSYRWIEGGKRETGERNEDGTAIYESVPGERTHYGFIAQEVKKAVDAAGVDFGGWLLSDKDDPDSQQALRYDQFIAPLTKALQEAITKIETLETANASQAATIAALDARLTALEGE